MENSMQSMKNNHSIDVDRLKNKVVELEKLTEKVHKSNLKFSTFNISSIIYLFI